LSRIGFLLGKMVETGNKSNEPITHSSLEDAAGCSLFFGATHHRETRDAQIGCESTIVDQKVFKESIHVSVIRRFVQREYIPAAVWNQHGAAGTPADDGRHVQVAHPLCWLANALR
jgi:hypothetical protein